MNSEPYSLAWDLTAPIEWECPGLSPHPARVRPNHKALTWTSLAPERHRVHEHTFAGPWRREESRHWWQLLLLGGAR
ncbi:hypothetical protein ABZ297_04055 [Nonomuraea sp. NPDC005983]|uniref:hypothetical protein n=1 Tax=Nonomuraea sp. NPDC005983 TaxID=3155595 RepID=UPI0033A3CD6B